MIFISISLAYSSSKANVLMLSVKHFEIYAIAQIIIEIFLSF